MRRRAALMASAWLSAAAALLADPAYATDFLVGTEAQLRSAITSAANGDSNILHPLPSQPSHHAGCRRDLRHAASATGSL
jgi:hypothetical protein